MEAAVTIFNSYHFTAFVLTHGHSLGDEEGLVVFNFDQAFSGVQSYDYFVHGVFLLRTGD
ncbi:hypothetical protein D3C71_2161940 [compost metagenome]